MQLAQAEQLVNSYANWIKQNLYVKEINNFIEITTPFLDRHNDHIQLYIDTRQGEHILTDDGYTISDLASGGMEINTEKRKQIINSILNGFGVHQKGEELYVKVSERDFAQKNHNLIQAILSIDDMFVMASPHVENLFKEDVEKFFKENEVHYSRNIHFAGKSGLHHQFDFLISGFKEKPERIIKAINNPDKNQIEILMFTWQDTISNRKGNSQLYTIMNDTKKSVKPDFLSALEEYNINPIVWSHIGDYINVFTN